MRLKGKNAIVTGGSSGIGRGIAIRFAQEGASVCIADVKKHLADNQISDVLDTDVIVSKYNVTGSFIHTDVSVEEDVANLFSTAVHQMGRIDIVVNNAAIFESFPIVDTSLESWNRVMGVNLRGQYLVAREAIKVMLTQDRVNDVRGRVINMSSQHGMIGCSDRFAYGVAKGGVVNMTRQLAVDYGKEGILVNGIAPGRILTTQANEEDVAKNDPSVSYALMRMPFGRLGRVSDITGPAVFLASDDCSYISGHNLVVDGGWLAH